MAQGDEFRPSAHSEALHAPFDSGSRWELTAPESYVLEFQGNWAGGQPLELAVKQLVVGRVLCVAQAQPARLRGRKPRPVLVDGPNARSEVPPVLAPVLAAYHRARRRPVEVLDPGSPLPVRAEGVLIKDMVRAVFNELKSRERYRERYVVPALVDRALIAPAGTRGLRGTTEYAWTPAGRKALARLDELKAIGRQHLRAWTHADPARGLAYLASAGSLVLLMSDLYPELEALSDRTREIVGSPGFFDGPGYAITVEALGDLGGLGGLEGLGDLGGLGGFGGFGDFGGGGGGDGGGGGG